VQAISVEEAVAKINDGESLLIGGFMAVGSPERVIEEIVRQAKHELTMIANDTAMPGQGHSVLRPEMTSMACWWCSAKCSRPSTGLNPGRRSIVSVCCAKRRAPVAHEPLWHQIAVADGKRGDECEIERIAERPSLKKADKRPQHELKGHEPRHNWPNDT
jgi:hypothetical protein